MGPLTWLIALPLLGAAAAAAVGRDRERALRTVGLVTSVLVFAIAALVWGRFAPGAASLQFEEKAPWVPGVGLVYHLGVDGLSVSLVALTALLFPLALGAAAQQMDGRTKGLPFAAVPNLSCIGCAWLRLAPGRQYSRFCSAVWFRGGFEDHQ